MNPKIAVAQIPSVKGNISANIATHISVIEKAGELGIQFVQFPELSMTGYELELGSRLGFTLHDQRIRPLIDSAVKHNINVGVGVPLIGNSGIHIASLFISSTGKISSYAKIHLHQGERKYFVEGATHHLSKINTITIASAICADISHAIHPRTCAQLGAEAYMASVLISKDGYKEDAALLRGYSEEFSMLVAIANHNQPTGGWQPSGKSALWFGGKLLAVANATQNALVVAEKKQGIWSGRVVELII